MSIFSPIRTSKVANVYHALILLLHIIARQPRLVHTSLLGFTHVSGFQDTFHLSLIFAPSRLSWRQAEAAELGRVPTIRSLRSLIEDLRSQIPPIGRVSRVSNGSAFSADIIVVSWFAAQCLFVSVSKWSTLHGGEGHP
jgi:hypothetical protein